VFAMFADRHFQPPKARFFIGCEPPQIVMCVIVLLAYGCPIQAIVKAFVLDERTVRNWQKQAGQHCQQVHEHLVENSQHDLEQVQADEIKAKTQQGTL